jgi:hypothetical protein
VKGFGIDYVDAIVMKEAGNPKVRAVEIEADGGKENDSKCKRENHFFYLKILPKGHLVTLNPHLSRFFFH